MQCLVGTYVDEILACLPVSVQRAQMERLCGYIVERVEVLLFLELTMIE